MRRTHRPAKTPYADFFNNINDCLFASVTQSCPSTVDIAAAPSDDHPDHLAPPDASMLLWGNNTHARN